MIMEENPRIRTIVAQNVKKYRLLNNLTQEKLAELADVSNTYIANIECGQTWVSDKTVRKISAALHVEEYLLFMPETSNIKMTGDIKKQRELIEYLSSRKKTLGNYVDSFFSETFDYILQEK